MPEFHSWTLTPAKISILDLSKFEKEVSLGTGTASTQIQIGITSEEERVLLGEISPLPTDMLRARIFCLVHKVEGIEAWAEIRKASIHAELVIANLFTGHSELFPAEIRFADYGVDRVQALVATTSEPVYIEPFVRLGGTLTDMTEFFTKE